MKVVRFAGGARLIDGIDVISEISARPGPTDTFFDLLAATVAVLAPGPQVLMLGFAGGGVIAPLRSLGFDSAIEAVDISRTGYSLFRELCGSWAGDVELHLSDAGRWLRRRRRRFDLILEDIAVPGPHGMTKPPASIDVLPELMHQRVRAGGLVITNLLPVPGLTWGELLARLSTPWRRCVVLRPTEYENRVLIAGRLPDTATGVSRRLRAALRSIGSLQSDRFAIQTLK